MNCETFRDEAFDFLDGTLGDRREFEDHFAACPRCASLLRGIEANEKTLALARVPVAPPELWPRIAAAISAGRPLEFRRPRLASILAAAAGLLLVLGLLFSAGAPPATLDVVVVAAGADAQRNLRGLIPSYGDVDAATAFVDTLFRSDF